MKISFKFLPLEEFTVHGPRITQNLPYMVQDSHRIYFTWSKIHTEFTVSTDTSYFGHSGFTRLPRWICFKWKNLDESVSKGRNYILYSHFFFTYYFIFFNFICVYFLLSYDQRNCSDCFHRELGYLTSFHSTCLILGYVSYFHFM